MFVLAMGLLALVHATGRARWARHWPLVFMGLAGFMLVRNDPGSWPLGPLGFWESMLYPEVLQHRIFVLLVIAFGVFEWLIRTDRVRFKGAALIFPLLCSVGGGLLLTHSHAGLNLKEEYLVEVTHVPLGLLAIITGWGRWLELRLPPASRRLPGLIWPLALPLFGVPPLLSREGCPALPSRRAPRARWGAARHSGRPERPGGGAPLHRGSPLGARHRALLPRRARRAVRHAGLALCLLARQRSVPGARGIAPCRGSVQHDHADRRGWRRGRQGLAAPRLRAARRDARVRDRREDHDHLGSGRLLFRGRGAGVAHGTGRHGAP